MPAFDIRTMKFKGVVLVISIVLLESDLSHSQGNVGTTVEECSKAAASGSIPISVLPLCGVLSPEQIDKLYASSPCDPAKFVQSFAGSAAVIGPPNWKPVRGFDLRYFFLGAPAIASRNTVILPVLYWPAGQAANYLLMRSTDAGQSWQYVFTAPDFWNGIAFDDSGHGLAAGNPAALASTGDTGLNWSPIDSGLSPCSSVSRPVISTDGFVYVSAVDAPECGKTRTTNEFFVLRSMLTNVSWQKLLTDPSLKHAPGALFVVESTNLFGPHRNGVFESSDRGLNWKYQELGGASEQLTLVTGGYCPSSVHKQFLAGYVGGIYGKGVLFFRDGVTDNWTRLSHSVPILQFACNSFGLFAVTFGPAGNALHYSADGTSWREADLGVGSSPLQVVLTENVGYASGMQTTSGGARMGALWKSDDAGKTWKELPFQADIP